MTRRPLLGLAVASAMALAFGVCAAAPARSAGSALSCAVLGYTPRPGEDAEQLRSSARLWHPQEIRGGVSLTSGGRWQIPASTEPVLVVHSSEPLTHGRAEVSVLGRRMPLAEGSGPAASSYVSTATTPLLGRWTRQVGITAYAGSCRGTVVISVDRHAYATVFGAGGLALVGFGVLVMVLLARRRRASWLSATLTAAPFGLIAGAGEALWLHETGALSPFSTVPWWLPLLGLVPAALLPLTRPPRRPSLPTPEQPPPDRQVTDGAADSASGSGCLTQPTSSLTAPEEPAPGTTGVQALPRPPEPDHPSAPTAAAAPASAIPALVHRAIGGLLILLLGTGGAAAPLAAPDAVDAVSAEALSPAAARIVFESLWNDDRSGDLDFYTVNPVLSFRTRLFERYPAFKSQPAVDVAVGVPPGQKAYPAYFVATAHTSIGGGKTLFFYLMLQRESEATPWVIVDLRAGLEARAVPRPKILPDGHLAPVPPATQLSVDPAGLSQGYATWFTRSTRGAGLVADGALALAPWSTTSAAPLPDSRGLDWASKQTNRRTRERGQSRSFTVRPASALPHQVPLADGSVLVSFAASIRVDYYNSDEPRTLPCSLNWLYYPSEPSLHYSHMATEFTLRPIAYVPPRTSQRRTLIDDTGPYTFTMDNTRC